MGEEHEDYCLDEYTYQFAPALLGGQVALVTGGGSGIGFRIAELFMRHGCDVVIASRNLKRLEEAAQRLRKATGRKCLTCALDVRKYDDVSNAVKKTLEAFQKIDILVNSAAGNFICPATSLSSNAFKTVLEIDTVGTYNATKAVYEHYFKEHGGVVINISATLHYTGTPMQAHVGSAKAAIDALTRHLAVEWGPQKVRINSIAPGPISGTEGMRRLGGASKAARDFITQQIPLQALGTRTNIAEAALFLASPISSFTTGAILVVDGGHWMTAGVGYNKLADLLSKL